MAERLHKIVTEMMILKFCVLQRAVLTAVSGEGGALLSSVRDLGALRGYMRAVAHISGCTGRSWCGCEQGTDLEEEGDLSLLPCCTAC